jgi:hypothetical protein
VAQIITDGLELTALRLSWSVTTHKANPRTIEVPDTLPPLQMNAFVARHSSATI